MHAGLKQDEGLGQALTSRKCDSLKLNYVKPLVLSLLHTLALKG